MKQKLFFLLIAVLLSAGMVVQAQQVQRISRTSQPKITPMVKHNVNTVQRAESSVAPVQDADRAEAKARHNAPDARVSPRRDAFPSFNYFDHTDGSNAGESFTWAQTTVSYLSNTNTPYYNVRGYKDESTYVMVSETWCFSNNSSYLPSGEYLSANTLAEGTMGVGSSTSDIRSYGGYVDWYDDGTFYIWILGRSDNTFAWVHNPNHSAKPMYFYSQGASYYNSRTWWTEIGTEPTKYTITFTWGNNGVEDGNDYEADTEEIIFGVEGNTFTMYNQSVFILTPSPKPGYRFVSWTGTGANEITNNGNGTYRLQMNGKNYSIAAVFEEIPPVDVTLSPNGGSGNDQIVSAMNGSAMPTTLKGGGSIVAPTRTGYVFGGYVANTNGTGRQYYNANLTSANTWDKDVAATIYAKWTAAQYNITYKDQGNANYSGNNAGSLVAKHTYGTPTTLVDGAKNGYTFGGWYENSSCTGEPVTTIGATGKTADFTLYAKWTQNVYHLNLTSGGNGTVSRSDDGTSSTDLHAGDQITLSYTPAGGYGFVNWTGTGSAYVSNNVFTVPNGTNGTTYTVQANFGAIHTITVSADPVAGGTVSGGGTYAEGANVTLTATPNSGYSFSRWSDGNTSNPRNVTMGNADATYTAEFLQQLYDFEYRFTWSDMVSSECGQKYSSTGYNNKHYVLRTKVMKNTNSNPGLRIDMVTSQSSNKSQGYKTYNNVKLPYPATYTSTTNTVSYQNRGKVITSASNGTYVTQVYDESGTAYTLSNLTNGKVQYKEVAGQTYPFVYVKGNFNNKTVFATIGVAPTYTITLNSQRSGVNATNSGTTSVTATYTYNTYTPNPIVTPTLTGYTFGGYWTGNGGTGTQIIDADGNFIADVSGYTDALKRWFYENNVTLYAKWTPNTYYVAFVAGEGSGTAMTNQTFTYGTAQNLKANTYVGPAVTVTYNYHGATSGNSTTSATVNAPFDMWQESLTEEWFDDKQSVSNLTATNGATVTMTALWGSTYPSVTLPSPVKSGSTFNGWYTAETGGTRVGGAGDSYTPTAGITLHAQWIASNYTITYNAGANGTGAAIANGSKTPGVNFTLSSSTYSREGYTQTGWSTTDGGSKAYDLGGTYSTDANLDLYPFWTANTFTVRFNANGGGSSMGNQNFTYGTSQNLNSNTFTAPTGKHFAGWATSQANANAGTVAYADGARGDQITTSNGVTVDLYAVWTANTYYVSFAANGGSGTMTNQTFTYGVAQNLKANTFTAPTATATFNYNGATGGNSPASATVTATPDGWTWTDDNDQEQYSDEEASVSNLTATNGATVALTANWGWYEDITLPSPTKTGYEFHQWTFTMEEMPMSEDAGAEVPISEDVTMTALWNIVTYNLTYEGLNGASSNNPETYTVETATFALANPDTRTGYTFTGWTCGGNPITQITLGSTGDKTITANWSTNTHNVSWVTDGNTLTGTYTNGTTAYGTTIVAPATPTKNATAQYTYTFNGWSPAVDATMPDNDVTYTAQWTQTPVNYTLTWTTDGDALTGTYTSGTVAYGTTIVAPATPTKTGYTFAGWDVIPASTMPAANTTYTAQWTANTYNLTYEGLNGATNTNPATYTIESETITLADPGARDGYAFTGWTINGTPVTEITHGSTGDKTLTANWNAKLSAITLEDNRENSFYNTFKSTYDGATGLIVTYARQFTKGRWSTLCLPFDVNSTMFSSLNFGSRIYEFKYATGNANDNSGVNLYFSIAKSIEAGKGYIVNADDKLAKRTSFVFPGVTINLSADKGDELNSVTAYDKLTNGCSTDGNIELVGTLRKGTLKGSAAGNRYMGLKDNKIYYPNITTTTGSTILAYRGIFRSIEGTLNAERIRIIVDGEEKAELEVINGELQDVQETKKFIENGVLYIERNGIIYDATGRKVE